MLKKIGETMPEIQIFKPLELPCVLRPFVLTSML